MAAVGDRVEVLSKAGTRQGVVTRVSGALVTVEWDIGGSTTVIPAPGVMSVIGGGRKAAARKAPAKKKAAPAKKKAPAKKAAAKKKAPVKKKTAPAKKKPAAKKKRR
jgi:hypothetical protein